MKRKAFFTLFLALLVNVSFASTDNIITKNELPALARFFLRTEFPNSKILSININSEKQIEVLTHDESKIAFDEEGNWIDLVCPKVGVPSFIIPQKIQKALRKNCGPSTIVVQLKKLSRGRYDVELSNGFGLRFDKQLDIIDVRDKALMVQSK